MKMIGITGQTGVGKTLLAKEFENEDTFIIDIDKLTGIFSSDTTTLDEINDYFDEKYETFPWEQLMSSRNDVQQLEDPLWKKIESLIDRNIQQASAKKIKMIVFDYALLPKTKYFDICDYNILLLPSSNELRKQSVLKRDNLANTERLDRRDRYSVDYRNYKFNKIAINSYDKNQFSSLKDSILEELEMKKTDYTEQREE